MRIVSLAGTPVSTSRLGFGTSGLHQLLRSRARQDLLATAFDVGVRHFDTSPYYGHGIAERELGKFTRHRRGQMLIATKFGIGANPIFAKFPWLMYAQLSLNAAQRKVTNRNRFLLKIRHDHGARAARASLEQSLRALRTDHVDIYFLHDPNVARLHDSDDLILTLEKLREEGKTRYVGLAGSARDCIDVARRFPGLAQIMQIGAAGGGHDLNMVRDAGLPCHTSYGHFRDKEGSLKALLQDAIEQNASGVILFSSRRAARIAELARHLDELEK
jgi:aryl-alcohol dehydrogenase-like predicted oxidoreductase